VGAIDVHGKNGGSDVVDAAMNGVIIFSQRNPLLYASYDEDKDEDEEPVPSSSSSLTTAKRLSSRLSVLFSASAMPSTSRPTSSRTLQAWKSADQVLAQPPPRKPSMLFKSFSQSSVTNNASTSAAPTPVTASNRLDSATAIDSIYQPDPTWFEVDPLKDSQMLVLEHLAAKSKRESLQCNPELIHSDLERLGLPSANQRKLRQRMSQRGSVTRAPGLLMRGTYDIP